MQAVRVRRPPRRSQANSNFTRDLQCSSSTGPDDGDRDRGGSHPRTCSFMSRTTTIDYGKAWRVRRISALLGTIRRIGERHRNCWRPPPSRANPSDGGPLDRFPYSDAIQQNLFLGTMRNLRRTDSMSPPNSHDELRILAATSLPRTESCDSVPVSKRQALSAARSKRNTTVPKPPTFLETC